MDDKSSPAGSPSLSPSPSSSDLQTLVNAARANLDEAIRRRGHPPDEAIRQRDEIIRQADLRVVRRTQQLSALEGELGRLKDQAASATTPDADQKAAAQKPRPSRR